MRVITLFFTDIENSTVLQNKAGAHFRRALKRHHEIVRAAFAAHGGHEFQESGDGFLAAFDVPEKAVACAIAVQADLTAEAWPQETGPLRVRIALHTGEAEFEEGQYRGLPMNRAARLLAAAHGGQILCCEATARASEKVAMIRNLGEYRLRGFDDVTRIFQVSSAGESPHFPPPRAVPANAHHVPATQDSFIGREEELSKIYALLSPADNPRTRVVTLTGPGGTGKTRLSLAAANRLLPEWSHAVTFVPLAEIDTPERLPTALRDAMRLPAKAGVDPLDQVMEILQQGPTLLILDNFEQLAIEGAPFIEELLRRAPSLACLVSSRQKLGIPGEYELPVLPLPLPTRNKPEELPKNESVRLFVERSITARPDFAVDDTDLPTVADLCRMLEGMPLAIELAAARSGAMTPREMLDELGSRLTTLGDTSGTRPARHCSLHAAIEWSWDALPPDLQRFASALATFRGGCTAEAAAFVHGAIKTGAARHYLQQLRNCSLTRSEEHGEGMRFTQLEAIRQFGAERLDALQDATLIRERHREFFSKRIIDSWPLLLACDPQRLRELRADHENLIYTITTTSAVRPRLQLVNCLVRYWQFTGRIQEGLRLMAEANTIDETQLPQVAERTFQNRGILHSAAGRRSEARCDFERSLAICRRMGSDESVAGNLGNIGSIDMIEGNLVEARRNFEETVLLFRKAGVAENLAVPLFNLAIIALRPPQNLPLAQQYLDEAFEILKHSNHHLFLRHVYVSFASLATCRGNLNEANRHHVTHLTMALETGDSRQISESLLGLAQTAIAHHDWQGTTRLLAKIDSLMAHSQVVLSDFGPKDYEGYLALTRQHLSGEQFQTAWKEGTEISAERFLEMVKEQPSQTSEEQT